MSGDHCQSGFSLVELMVALALGLLLSAGISNIYIESKNSLIQDEEIARVQENGRFALRMLSREIGMAGYMGGVVQHSSLGSIPIVTDCGAGAGDDWVTDIDSTMEVVNDAAATVSGSYSCFDSTDFVTDTDIVIIKRTSDDQVIEDGAWQNGMSSLIPDRIYLRANNGGVGESNFGSGTAVSVDLESIIGPATGVDVWEYYVKIFHIANSDGVPNLCYYRLTDTGNMSARECLLAGVENLQIELGVDLDGDDFPDQFQASSTNPPTLGGTSLEDVVAVRIYVLVRSTGSTAAGPTRAVTYQLGQKSVVTNDRVYRRVFSTTVKMRNPLYVDET